jgi:hypothetical protein
MSCREKIKRISETNNKHQKFVCQSLGVFFCECKRQENGRNKTKILVEKHKNFQTLVTDTQQQKN